MPFDAIPWFAPSLIVLSVSSLGVARLVSRRLKVRAFSAYVVVWSTGLILAATLLPLAVREATWQYGGCDLSRTGLVDLRSLVLLTDEGLNVVLFAPLGMALGSIRGSSGWTRMVVLAAVLPLGIESIQALVAALGRGCESGDVIDNLTGLSFGLVAGLALRGLTRASTARVRDD